MSTVKKGQIPVYRARRSSLRRKSLPMNEKNELYEFKCDENNPGKKLKKTQKVRKRARIVVRKKDIPQVKKVLSGVDNKENVEHVQSPKKVNMENKVEKRVLKPLASKENIPEVVCPDVVIDKNDSISNKTPRRVDSGFRLESIKMTPIPLSPDIPVIMTSPYNNYSPVACSPNNLTAYYSTPAKDPYDLNLTRRSCSPFDVSNCFGFNDEDSPEELVVSPISLKDTRKSPPPLVARPTVSDPSVKDVIRLLKFDVEETDKVDSIFTPSVEVSVDASANHVVDFEPDTSIPKVVHHRRSYERPIYLRKLSKSFHEESDHEEQEAPKKVPARKKKEKKDAPSKKEQKELDEWARAFNSQCEQVDAFDLCIE